MINFPKSFKIKVILTAILLVSTLMLPPGYTRNTVPAVPAPCETPDACAEERQAADDAYLFVLQTEADLQANADEIASLKAEYRRLVHVYVQRAELCDRAPAPERAECRDRLQREIWPVVRSLERRIDSLERQREILNQNYQRALDAYHAALQALAECESKHTKCVIEQ